MVSALGWVAVLLACLLWPATAHPEEEVRNVLYVSGQVMSLESDAVGGGGGLEWWHQLSASSAITLGAFAFSLADSHWAYGKTGLSLSYPTGTSVSANASLGGGRRLRDDFIYQVGEVEVTQALIDKRLYLVGGDQYAHVSRSQENLVKAGLLVYPIPTLAIRANYHYSLGGNVDSQFVSGRADLTLARLTLLAGFLLGRTTPERFNVITNTARAVRSEEFFAGISVPLGRHEVTVVYDLARQGSPWIDKHTILLVWKIPF